LFEVASFVSANNMCLFEALYQFWAPKVMPHLYSCHSGYTPLKLVKIQGTQEGVPESLFEGAPIVSADNTCFFVAPYQFWAFGLCRTCIFAIQPQISIEGLSYVGGQAGIVDSRVLLIASPIQKARQITSLV